MRPDFRKRLLEINATKTSKTEEYNQFAPLIKSIENRTIRFQEQGKLMLVKVTDVLVTRYGFAADAEFVQFLTVNNGLKKYIEEVIDDKHTFTPKTKWTFGSQWKALSFNKEGNYFHIPYVNCDFWV